MVRGAIIACHNSHTMKMMRFKRMVRMMMMIMMAMMTTKRKIIMVMVIEWLELKEGSSNFPQNRPLGRQ